MFGLPYFPFENHPPTIKACPTQGALSRGCLKQQTRMLSSSFLMHFSSKLILPVILSFSTLASAAKASQFGQASWYGPGFYGNRTANGEIFRPGTMTAAHRYLPFGTRVRVTNVNNGRSVVVRINDRGPYHGGRIIDLAEEAATQLGLKSSGVADVRLQVLN